MSFTASSLNSFVNLRRSNSAKRALDVAINQAKALNGYVYVISSLRGGTDTRSDEIIRLEKELNECQKKIKKEGVLGETHLVVKGHSPGEDIVNYAKDKSVDQIIISIKKKSKVGKLLFGSNAQHVILKAHCPVLTVK